jgi:hypothetical protein
MTEIELNIATLDKALARLDAAGAREATDRLRFSLLRGHTVEAESLLMLMTTLRGVLHRLVEPKQLLPGIAIRSYDPRPEADR